MAQSARESGTPTSADPNEDLRRRILELEQRLAAPDSASTESSNQPTPASLANHPNEQPGFSKRQRKKKAKQSRKAAVFLEKTQLHSSKTYGMVGAEDRVVVPAYSINGGADIKWESDPCDLDLKGILSPQEYFTAITTLNEAVSHARAKPIDTVLAVSAGFLLLPLIPWAIRHRKHRTKHKKILIEQLRLFNNQYASRGVRMRWRRKPYSELVIERFPLQSVPCDPSDTAVATARAAVVVNPSGSAPVNCGAGGGGAIPALATVVQDSSATTDASAATSAAPDKPPAQQ